MNKKYLLLIFTFLFIFISCEEEGVKSKFKDGTLEQTYEGGTTTPPEGSTSNPGNGGVTNGGEETAPKVEVRHLIEPKIDINSDVGAYIRKLSIPKNYNGFLYIAGLNLSTLSSKIVKVRFLFGQDRTPIEVPATVTNAAGLTPQTSTEVLVLDLKGKPFYDVRLLYDLYDYSSYENGDEPTQNNRDPNLFCRGLRLQDDPTNSTSSCNAATDVCKYSYAKVYDKGLVNNSTQIAVNPSGVQVADESGGGSYYTNSDASILNRCLPDSDSNPYPSGLLNPGSLINSQYTFIGPYGLSGKSLWQISSAAVYSEFGLFAKNSVDSNLSNPDPDLFKYGYESKLFPLSTKLNINKNTDYLYVDSNGDSDVTRLSQNGETQTMYGCNARVSTRDEVNGESIGSCNVTARIEIVAKDPETGTESVIDSSKDVKLQLVKEASFDPSTGVDVLSSSFQSCTSSSQCGGESCCFNNRCWSKSIVSQCIDETVPQGNLLPGAVCGSDLQCASLCCNPSSGKCGVHDTLSDPQVLCSKPFGNACIAKEWCAKETKTRCFIVKTGFDSQNQTTCALRCYTTREFGDCMNGICVPGPTPEVPVFNPNDPNRCDEAYDPSELPINI